MKLIGYKTFEDDRDFISWQKENLDCSIINVVPFVNYVELDMETKQVKEEFVDVPPVHSMGSINVIDGVNIFVTFSYNED